MIYSKMIRFSAVILLLSMVTMVSCSDDSTSPDLDDPPSLPSELMPADVDLSYFQSQDVPDTENHTTFKQVESIAYMGGTVVQGAGMVGIATTFIEMAPFFNVNPEKEGDKWVWNFNNIPLGGFKSVEPEFGSTERVPFSNQESISLKITATPHSGGIEWEIFFTGNLGEEGSVTDFRLMSGFTDDDGTQGEWLFYLPQSGNTPVYKYEYNLTGENEYKASYEVNFEGEVFRIDFERNAPENWISIIGGGENVTAYWNESTHTGWVEENNQRVCYVNYENSAC